MKKHLIAAVTAVSMLAACGGGGDSSTTTTSPSGYWTEPDFGMLVTNSGEIWGVDASSSTYGLLVGNLTTSGDKFTASLKVYRGGASASASASGSFVEKKTFSGTAVAGADSDAFKLTYDNAYEAVPSLSRIAGTYSVSSGGSLVVSAAGSISGTSGGCAVTGTVAPGTDGGNYYRLSVKFGAAPCAIPNGTATGVVGQSGTRLIGGVVSGNLGDAFILTKI